MDLPSDIGYMTVSLDAIIALADSSDPGSEPDALQALGTVTLAPTVTAPIWDYDDQCVILLSTITCQLTPNGLLTADGQPVNIVAPIQTCLADQSWMWVLTAKPAKSQSWVPFTTTFTGKPGDEANIGDPSLSNVAVPPSARPVILMSTESAALVPTTAQNGDTWVAADTGQIGSVTITGGTVSLVPLGSIKGPTGDVTPAATAAETAAQTAATSAAASATNAANSLMSVTSQASAAAASATNAANSASAAATSATAAANSASQVANNITTIGTATRGALDALYQKSAGPCLAAFFRVGDEVARFAYSPDGVNFDEIGPSYSPSDSTVRDPSITVWNGTYVMAYTRPTAAGGGAFGTITTMGFASSPNGRTWTEGAVVSVSGASRVWAPDFFVDGTTLRVLFAVSASLSGLSDFHTYEIHTTASTLTSWSTPVALTNYPLGIDTHIVKTSSGYAAFYSNPSSNICSATATSVLGAWTDNGVVDSGWAEAEGPTSLPLPNGGIRLYVDSGGFLQNLDSTQNQSSQGENEGIFYSDFSADLSQHSTLTHVSLPMRHIGIIPLAGNTSPATMKGKSMRAAGALYITGDGSSYDQSVTLSSTSSWTPFTSFNSSHLIGGMQTNAGTLVIPQDGRYLVTASAVGVAMSTGWFEIRIQLNGTTLDGWIGGSSPAGDTTDVQENNLPPMVHAFSQGDVVQLVYRGTCSGSAPGFRASRTTLTVVEL